MPLLPRRACFFSLSFPFSPVSKDDRGTAGGYLCTALHVLWLERGCWASWCPGVDGAHWSRRAHQEAGAQQRLSEQLANAKPSGKRRPPRNAFPILILPRLRLSGASAEERNLLPLAQCNQRGQPTYSPPFFCHLQGAALYFSTRRRNPKPAASQIRLPGPQRAARTAGCSAGAAALPSRLQREPDAGNVPGRAGLAEPESLGWESQTSR